MPGLDLAAVGDTELAAEAQHVTLDGPHRHAKTVGDLSVPPAFHDVLGDLVLPIRERRPAGLIATRTVGA